MPTKKPKPDLVKAADDFSRKYEDVFGDKDPQDIINELRGDGDVPGASMNSSGESAAREQSLSDIARDYLLERDYEMFLSSHVGMSGKLLCDTMEAYAREQTAAKDAEAETFRCQLRDALKLHPNVTWFGAGLLTAASAVVAERDSLREANARLAADLDAALKAGKE